MKAGIFKKILSGLFSQEKEIGQPAILWAVIALFSLFTQVALHRNLIPGEFGTFNTALGAIGLMLVPVIALIQAFAWHFARKHAPGREKQLEELRASESTVIETLTWVWACVAGILILSFIWILELPRYTLIFFVLLNVLVGLGTCLSGATYYKNGRILFWAWLLVGAAIARLIGCMTLAVSEPWAETALAVFFVVGVFTFVSALRPDEIPLSQRIKALKTIMDRDFLVDLGAIFSVLLAIYLFTNGDRIVAQSWFGVAGTNDSNIVYIDWYVFDAYQTAGLLSRSILWGAQPLLFILFFRRAKLDRTTGASLFWFWIYLGALAVGVTLVDIFPEQLARLFCGEDYGKTANFIPALTLAMIPLGLLQGVGIFGLASRRYLECFIFGACGIAYIILLDVAGRHPQLMPAYMFGGGLVALMIVLFIGVVRWGRKQP